MTSNRISALIRIEPISNIASKPFNYIEGEKMQNNSRNSTAHIPTGMSNGWSHVQQ